jgi:putative serine protease PepD
VAIGSPFGLDATVTSGIVSALNRPVNVGQVSQGNATVYPAIQTTPRSTPVTPVPAGQPRREVVGIDASIQTATDTTGGGEPGSIGLGLRDPDRRGAADRAGDDQGRDPDHARLGIAWRTPPPVLAPR